jgi:hypothetical protein
MPDNYSFSFGVATHQLQMCGDTSAADMWRHISCSRYVATHQLQQICSNNNKFIQFVRISIKYIMFQLFIKTKKIFETKHTSSCCAITYVKWRFHDVSSRTQPRHPTRRPRLLTSLFHWRLRKGRNTVRKIGSRKKAAINMSYKLRALIRVELLYLSLVHFQHIFRPILACFLLHYFIFFLQFPAGLLFPLLIPTFLASVLLPLRYIP